uniref:MBOAT family protein n=1 Tax=Steinernema glaseri TaxID=37863 RepID=A0A1I8ACR3_9BILA
MAALLPTWEHRFYLIVSALHFLAAFVVAIYTSDEVKVWLRQWLIDSDYISGWKRDGSDIEWSLFRTSIRGTLVFFAIHSIAFHFVHKNCKGKTAAYVLIVFWTFLHIVFSSLTCLTVLAVLATLTVLLTVKLKSEVPAWVICIGFVLTVNTYARFSVNPANYYREFNIYFYTAVQILNFCIYLNRHSNYDVSKPVILRFVQFLLYPPYTMTLIVLYEDFDRQMTQRENGDDPKNDFATMAKKLLRLLFWAAFLDALHHVLYVNALFSSPFTLIKGLNNYKLASLAYTAGQLFHVKYVVLFGIPSWFALVDGMDPPGPPICISRVSKYSQMWRYFDRGLYEFLKNQVYIPLMKNQTGVALITRRLFAMVSAFLFVLAWHGTSLNYISWVSLSALELCIERVGKAIGRTSRYQQLSVAIGQRNVTRLQSIAMLSTVIPGIFGVFFFLGSEGIGSTIFKSVLVDGFLELVTLRIRLGEAGQVLLHLLILGYAFNATCLYLEDERKKKTKSQ